MILIKIIKVNKSNFIIDSEKIKRQTMRHFKIDSNCVKAKMRR